LPHEAKYVVFLRDPGDASVSMLRFMEGWFIEPGTISAEHIFENWRRAAGPTAATRA
jgi:hypothetical protein